MPKEGDVGARLASGAHELVFAWSADRFHHQVFPRAVSSPTPAEGVLEAVTLEAFVAPVFQEVHQQGDVVFASGMSGHLLWSASVEPTDGGFLFDVACRIKGGRSRPGWGYSGAGWRVENAGGEGACLVGSDKEESSWLVRPAKLPEESPTTVRCRYRVVAA